MKNKLVYVVLDDDPTGVQTVHDVPVYTHGDYKSVLSGFEEPTNLFFILTNSRSFSSKKTKCVHSIIASNIVRASKETNRPFIIISRGDSTLRGHFPLETDTLRNTVEEECDYKIDGVFLIPFFLEGGRITVDDIHYVIENGKRVPCGETEFSKDKTFPYYSSNLKDWIEEKSNGAIRANNVISLNPKVDNASQMLSKIINQPSFKYFIVNAESYEELVPFTKAFEKAIKSGKHYIIRSAASVVKSLAGISDKALLQKKDLIDMDNNNGGLVIIGSHVKKTTNQFELLKSDKDIVFVEFNQHLVLTDGLDKEVARVVKMLDELIPQGVNVVVYTNRVRVDFPYDDKEKNLRMSLQIADAITSIVANLEERPSFIVAKGGITSSDIGTKALEVKKAIVLGQIEKGIPVWNTGCDSKFPNLPYVIFPGNVGEIDTLLKVVHKLMSTD